ncbi:hypothetical protein ABZ345_31045 [Lentzea sp. NPDC005914]|uniref:hypothetical protein n=1 Tax=Lentzea sp. NPDC005914 TaxID=3154572 RepID=UPI0033E24360
MPDVPHHSVRFAFDILVGSSKGIGVNISKRVAVTLSAAVMGAGLLGATANADPVGTLAVNPVSCTNGSAVHVTVPYYPYAYCYAGSGGSRRVQLTQVRRVESRGRTMTFWWRDCGSSTLRRASLVPHESIPFACAFVDTISIP